MRKLLIAATVVATLAALPVLADGPSGSTEKNSSGGYTNNVKCGTGAGNTDTPVATVYAGTNGVEICNDGDGALPVQGRIIATTDQGGYIGADGDKDNMAPADGWARLDSNGLRCGKANGNRDVTAPQDGDGPDQCG